MSDDSTLTEDGNDSIWVILLIGFLLIGLVNLALAPPSSPVLRSAQAQEEECLE